MRARFIGLVLTVAAAAACGGTSDGTLPGGTVPYARDFEGFESWQSETIETTTESGSTHVSGSRTIYINHMPDPAATTFDDGTLIVKRTTADGKLFARAKRGGDFNLRGAVGWEWLELEERPTGLVIRWRGLGPPKGEMYGGDPNGGCNLCHKLAVTNDYVLTPGFRLAGASDAAIELPHLDAGADAPSDDAAAHE
jgi:hypothetical protein